MDKKAAIGIAAAFAIGFVAGHFGGQSVFGYRDFHECFAKETKGAAIGGAIFAARQYCGGLFPGQDQ